MIEAPAPPASLRAVCVAIHDVAPATWPLCQLLLEKVHAVARIPVTLLVVPDYHGQQVGNTAAYERGLALHLEQGDELALHGYRHVDDGATPANLRQRWVRRVYTTGEGEFAALGVQEATLRIASGLEWFARREWPVQGFVAPAWLMSAGSWEALRSFPFTYTTTLNQFTLLPQMLPIFAPSLCYSTRNASGRWLSRKLNGALLGRLQQVPLVRLGLHPNDARFPALVAHFQNMLAVLLEQREAMTKAAFARHW